MVWCLTFLTVLGAGAHLENEESTHYFRYKQNSNISCIWKMVLEGCLCRHIIVTDPAGGEVCGNQGQVWNLLNRGKAEPEQLGSELQINTWVQPSTRSGTQQPTRLKQTLTLKMATFTNMMSYICENMTAILSIIDYNWLNGGFFKSCWQHKPYSP